MLGIAQAVGRWRGVAQLKEFNVYVPKLSVWSRAEWLFFDEVVSARMQGQPVKFARYHVDFAKQKARGAKLKRKASKSEDLFLGTYVLQPINLKTK